MSLERAKFTAEGVAAWRAAGAREKDERVRNPDFLAVKFLGPKLYLISQFPPLAKLALWRFQKLVPGGYYFQNARTRHIDATLKQCIAAGIEQLVILGAGYDSRPYRFLDLLKEVKVFEVDHPSTQASKKENLIKILGSLPEWVTFVAMDFNTERLDVRLPENGYDATRRTFFVWEGVCMYISPEAVDETLSYVAHHSATGSSIIFDYIYRSVVEGACDYYGAREASQYVAKIGEPYTFGIQEGATEQFLAQRGFELASDLSPQQLENTYLIRQDGKLHGRADGSGGIAHARVKSERQSAGHSGPHAVDDSTRITNH